jgi:hypothetical protein
VTSVVRLTGPKSPDTSCSHGTPAVALRCGDNPQRQGIDPDLEIVEAIWSDEVVRGLVDEWLVPAVLDRVMGDLLNSGGDAVR